MGGAGRVGAIVALGVLTLGVGLGSASRLTYHEAIWGQAAREMVGSGDWLVPTLGGRPWLEKPPLAVWLSAGLGRLTGRVGEVQARLPGAVAGGLVAMAVAGLAARRFGATAGLLAGLVQVTTAWLVTRARLAEPDVPLAAIVAGAVLAFDRVRLGGPSWRAWRWGFFGLLGASALLKGVGFGGALIAATVAAVLAWDRDWRTLRALCWPTGWALASGLALAWPLAVLGRHPEALGLWVHHVAGRLGERAEGFAGEPLWQYATAPLVLALPWTPLAVVGAWRSWRRARRPEGRLGLDRLLLAWAVVPSGLVSLASARNAHYLLHALPPLSVWSALGLIRLGHRLAGRGWTPRQTRRATAGLLLGLGLAWGLGYAVLGPRLDLRGKGAEWAFYEDAGRAVRPGEPVVLLYDALDHPDRWDRLPYPTPFGPVPPDLAVRLFYLDRPSGSVAWTFGLSGLAGMPGSGSRPILDQGDGWPGWSVETLVTQGWCGSGLGDETMARVGVGRGLGDETTATRKRFGEVSDRAWPGAFAVLARDRDRPALERLGLGPVVPVLRGPTGRWDRAFVLFRVGGDQPEGIRSATAAARTGSSARRRAAARQAWRTVAASRPPK